MSKFAWVTLATNDSYSLGALVLAHSLKRVSTAHQLAILITTGVSESMRAKLKDIFNVVQEVNVLDSQDATNLALLARPELGVTFTKLHCWRLIQFEKCVFLDADTLVLQNCDELFEREEFSAAPDVGWPDCFNSGVFVYRPSVDTFTKITEYALQKGSFDGGDQGLLNSYFSDWAHKDISKHLPFLYNTCSTATYSYLPAFKQFADRIKILHFIGQLKPWLLNFNSQNRTVYTPQEYGHLSGFLQLWWNIFCDNVHPNLSDQMKYHFFGEYSSVSYVDNANSLHFETYDIMQEKLEKVTFCDPWEDYYENLQKTKNFEADVFLQSEQDDNSNKINNNNSNNDNNSNTQVYGKNNNASSNNNNKSNNNKQINAVTNITHDTASHIRHEDIIDDPSKSFSAGDNNDNNNAINRLTIVQENVQQLDRDTNFNTRNSETTSTIDSNQENPDQNPCLSSDKPPDTTKFSTSTSSDNKSSTELNVNNDNNLISSSVTVVEEQTNIPTTIPANDNQEEAGLAGALAKVKLGEPRSAEQEAYEQHIRRQCWESGNVDYVGRDSFDNIWRKITETLESGTKKDEPSSQQSGKRFTSADIQDGKVEYDAETNSTITYKKIKGGYEMHIETPQPNGTKKFQTKTFYDPKPVSTEELEEETSTKRTTKRTDTTVAKNNPNATVVTRKIPGGREEITTTVNADGTSSIRTRTFYDEEEVQEETETTETEQTTPGRKVTTTMTKQPQQQQQPQQRRTSLKKTNSEENTSQEYNVKSQRVEESRRVTETHEVSGKSSKSTRKNSLEQQQQLQQQQLQQQNFQALTDNTQKKVKKNRFNQDDQVNIVSMKCPGGTEFRAATTVKKAEKKESTSRTVFEQTTTELTEREIKIYEKQKKEAQKIKHITETTELPCKSGTKKVIPSENPGDVTTLETRKVKGGTEFITTIVRSDGTVKKSTRTAFDPVPVEGDEDEQEIIEEFEEEIIEPGEPIVTTITKTVPRDVAEAKKKLGQDVPAFSDDGEFIENFPPKKRGGRK